MSTCQYDTTQCNHIYVNRYTDSEITHTRKYRQVKRHLENTNPPGQNARNAANESLNSQTTCKQLCKEQKHSVSERQKAKNMMFGFMKRF